MRFVLELHRSQQADDPYAFRTGRNDYVQRTSGGAAQAATFDWDEALISDLHAVQRAHCDPAIQQRLGDRIQRFVSALKWPVEQLAQALAAEEPVVLTLRLSAAELYALPWELLTLGPTGQHLGELPQVLLHYEWPETHTAPERPAPRPEGGRILLAWSAAGGAVPAAEHQRAIAESCQRGHLHFDPSQDALHQVSAEGLRVRLEQAAARGEPIAVLHILCHGGAAGATSGLLWDGPDGPEVIDGGRLRQLLGPYAGWVRMVVLCACNSGHAGQLGNHLGSLSQVLHRIGIQSVVASRFPLSVTGSVQLAQTLYEALLCETAPLEEALLLTRQRLLRNGGLDWGSLQLYKRQADGDDTRPVIFRPYRGLLSFGPEHQRFFCGRVLEVNEVIADLAALQQRQRPRFLIVAGASGTGKSSLVLARVMPELARRGGTTVKVLRPSAGGPAALAALLTERGDTHTPLLLVVDQFEEIFTALSAAARTPFVQRLWAAAADPASNITVLVTLRVDFIGQCGEVVIDEAGLRLDRVAYDEAHRVFVSQLDPGALRQAILQPAARVGLVLEPGLCDRLLADVGSEPGALPLLEYTLDQLWQRREGRLLTQAAYRELGEVSGALEREADLALRTFDAAQREAARHLLCALIAVGDGQGLDTRQRRSIGELRPGDPDQAARFDGVLDKLVNLRLLVRGEAEREPAVEVAHEALIRKWQTLRTWINEDRETLHLLQTLRQESHRWDAAGRVPEDLFRGRRLQRALVLRDRQALSPVEEAFLRASQAAAQQAQTAEAKRVQSHRDTDLGIGVRKRNQWLALLTCGHVMIWEWALTRPSGVTHGRIAALLALAIAGLAVAVLANLRGDLASTRINRHLAFLIAFALAVGLGHHAMGYALGIPPRSAMAVDLMVLGAINIAGTVWFWDRGYWLGGLPPLVAAALATIWPPWTVPLWLTVLPISTVWGLYIGFRQAKAQRSAGDTPLG